MPTLPSPHAILFDWDNTLADTWPIIHAALNDTLTAMNHAPWSIEKVKTNVHRSMRDSFPALFGERWQEAGEIYQTAYRTHRTTKLVPLPDAIALLDWLLAYEGIFVAVVSNKIGHSLREEITLFGWDHYFDAVVGAQDAKADKPFPDPVHLALKDSGLTPHHPMWFIGDSLTDMECAHNVGCIPIFYGDGDPTTKHYQHCPPRHHVKDHQALLALIQEIGLAAF
jgi:phosphoglycolate phosphatase